MLRSPSPLRASVRMLLTFAVVGALAIAGCASHDDLKQALSAGNVARVDALVRKESSPDFYVAQWLEVHVTPLMYAADHGKVDVVKRLLALGADPSFANEDGWTALTYACFRRRPEVVRVLLAHGADPVRAGKTGESCRNVIHRLKDDREQREPEMVRVLAEAKVPLDPWLKRPSDWVHGGNTIIEELIADAEREVLDAYFAHGVSVDARDANGVTLLMHAITTQNTDLVRWFLGKGADPRLRDGRGRDALAVARSTFEEPYAAVLVAALDPALASPAERVAAYDRADGERKEKMQALAKKDAEARRARAKVEAERERAAAAERQREAARLREAARSMPTSWPSTPNTSASGSYCDAPETRACMARGRSCTDCFYAAINANVGGRSGGKGRELSCPSSYTSCAGVCCGKGYVCCVGATSVNFGQEACRLSSRGCNQGWDAERIK